MFLSPTGTGSTTSLAPSFPNNNHDDDRSRIQSVRIPPTPNVKGAEKENQKETHYTRNPDEKVALLPTPPTVTHEHEFDDDLEDYISDSQEASTTPSMSSSASASTSKYSDHYHGLEISSSRSFPASLLNSPSQRSISSTPFRGMWTERKPTMTSSNRQQPLHPTPPSPLSRPRPPRRGTQGSFATLGQPSSSKAASGPHLSSGVEYTPTFTPPPLTDPSLAPSPAKGKLRQVPPMPIPSSSSLNVEISRDESIPSPLPPRRSRTHDLGTAGPSHKSILKSARTTTARIVEDKPRLRRTRRTYIEERGITRDFLLLIALCIAFAFASIIFLRPIVAAVLGLNTRSTAGFDFYLYD